MYDHEFPESERCNEQLDGLASSSNPSAGSKKRSDAPAVDATLRCAYCGKEFLRSQSPILPFCTRRCQQIDLGMWLNESYGLPCEGDEYAVDEIEED